MKPILVIATQPGFYGSLRDAGTQFEVASEADFSKHWMRRVDEKPADSDKKPTKT